jgi:hypothetical protein
MRTFLTTLSCAHISVDGVEPRRGALNVWGGAVNAGDVWPRGECIQYPRFGIDGSRQVAPSPDSLVHPHACGDSIAGASQIIRVGAL